MIAVGPIAKILADAATLQGCKKVYWFETVAESIQYLNERGTKKGENLLVKGSHSVHMEKIIENMEKING